MASNCTTPFLVAEIIERCGTHETGVRRLIGFIEQNLLPVLSRHWLNALQEKRTITRMSVDAKLRGTTGLDLQGGDVVICHTEYA
jgi:type VI secretion system protein VasG